MSDELPERAADEDAWLDALGAVAREEDAQADAPLLESGPLRALDDGERAQILDAILAAGAAAPADDALPLADVAAPSPPRRMGRAFAVGGLLLAALIALLALPAGPTLPAYTVEATAGAADVRGDQPPAAGETVYTAGTRFRLVLRPAADVAEPVRASVTLSGPDGAIDWQPPIAVGASGSVKIEGVFADALALPPGAYVATFTLIAGDSEPRAIEHRFRIAPGPARP